MPISVEGSEESSDDEEETIAGLGGGRTLCYERRITVCN